MEKERQAKVDELNKTKQIEVDHLNKELESLKEYKQAWEDAVNAYKKAQDEMNAAAMLGSDWRQKILDKDLNIIQTYQTGYNDLQNQLNNVLNPMIEQANKQIELYDKQIDSLKTQKEGYQDMLDAQKNYLDFFKTYAEDLQNATAKQKKAWDDLSDAIKKFTDISGFNSLADYYDKAMAVFDEDYIPENPNNADYSKDPQNWSLSEKLLANIAASKGVYDAVMKAVGLPEQMSKMYEEAVVKAGQAMANAVSNKDYSKHDVTEIINVHNPVLSMTKDEFMNMLADAFGQLDRKIQVGR